MSSLPSRTGPRLAEVMTCVRSDEHLSQTRRRDLCSALRRLSKMLNRPLEDLPANLSLLRPLVNGISPALHELSSKSWANLRSDLLAAVRQAGLAETRRKVLSPEWELFRAALPSKRLRWGLSRFSRFCSLQEIPPEGVSDRITEEFKLWLEANSLAARPSETLKRTCKLWNKAAQLLPEQALPALVPPAARSNRMPRLPLAAFPESFRADLEAYLAQRADPDPFDPDAPPKPAKPGTIKLLSEQLRLAANALVERGRDPATITSLGDLVEIEAFKEIQRQLLAEHDGAGSYWGEGVRKCLMTIAKHWCRVSEDRLKDLRHLSRRVPRPEPGLTPKNRRLLRQFDDEANLARLLHLPGRLFREACGISPPDLKAARQAQIALAIEMLLNCPIRAANLRALQLDRHILRPTGPRGLAFLCLEPAEVKNEQRVDFQLPDHLRDMIDTYVERFLPLFGGTDGFLFVTGTGMPRGYGTLAHQVCRTIRARTGVVLTLHQFRHLAAKLFLEKHPGGYEALRQLLGHRSIQTTVRSYAGVQTRQAARLHDQVLTERRAALQYLSIGKPRRRSRQL